MKARRTIPAGIELLLVVAASAFLCWIWPWQYVLDKSVTAGGDTASHFYPAQIMHDVLIPNLQWTGWTMGNYAGYPIFHFYSTLPFFLIGLLGYVMPLQISFKLVTLLGPTTLPLAAAYLFWALGYRRSGPVLAAGSVLPFLFQQGNSMWGGNIPSVLAGEFCHSIGFSLSLVFLGYLHRLSRGMGSWVVCGLLLAAVALSHAFAFIGALWLALWYIRPRTDSPLALPRIAPAFVLAGLLVAFWGFPLVPRVKFTTEWTMIWTINDWKEVVPELLWPASILTGVNVLLMLAGLKRYESDRQGLMLFALFGSVVLYGVSPMTGFPDIRFVPIGQLAVGLLAADLLVWLGTRLNFPLVYAAAGLSICMGWTYAHLGYLPSWLDWNYSGYEGKPSWDLFHAINEHVHGDINSPRMVFEHSQGHNRFGSSRAFENLPLFAGRSTLEGVFHQVSPNSPFVFYIQSEVGEKASGPFHQYSYARLDPQAALPHLRVYNVGTIVATTDKARAAYDANPSFHRTFNQGGYAVYDVPSGVTGYVVPAANQPVLYTGPDYRTAFYRWFKHPELLDVPLVPAEVAGPQGASRFPLQTASVRDIPRTPLGDDCKVTSHLEQESITFDTTCPGRPHIVKVSYFPRWKTVDGSPIDLVSPGFMLVTPHSTHFEMVYSQMPLDWLALATTWLGLLWAAAAALSGRARRATSLVFVRLLRPVGAWMTPARVRIPLCIALVVGSALAAGAVRYRIRDDDAAFREGSLAYQQRRFDDVIRILGEEVRSDSDRPRIATALIQLGDAYAETGKSELAIQALERLRFDFPNIDYGAQSGFHLAKSYAAIKSLDRAREYAAQLERQYADSSWTKRLKKENPELFPAVATPDQATAPAAQAPASVPPPPAKAAASVAGGHGPGN
ncbi:MAG TPA: 6-pyruvoyl-tetrahydropterin synthase-related protein [Candidatus Binatia bacterium]